MTRSTNDTSYTTRFALTTSRSSDTMMSFHLRGARETCLRLNEERALCIGHS